MTFAARPMFGGGAVVALSNRTISETQSLLPASAALQLTNGGVANQVLGIGGTTFLQNWLTPQSGMSGYEARATQTSSNGNGTLTGTLGTWLNLGTTRTWELAITGSAGTATRTLTVEIRDTATSTVQATATITLNATSNP